MFSLRSLKLVISNGIKPPIKEPFVPRRLKQLTLTALALTALGGLAGVGINAYILYQARDGVLEHPPTTLPPQTVALVLGARVFADGTPSSALRARLQTALSLYRAKKVSRILLTGDHGRDGYDELRPMYQWLHDRGVPRAHIFLDHAGFRTLDSMIRAKEIFEVSSVVICTQRFHMARSVYLARTVGIEAIGVNASDDIYVPSKRMHAREFVARIGAFVDVHLLNTSADLLGPKIPITGSSEPTYDF